MIFVEELLERLTLPTRAAYTKRKQTGHIATSNKADVTI